ncbi:MAG: hypothetical protein K6A94_04820 [Bacteroidales bacterium]|nr:hypothetical protein [Bacteroidales bacterium]
MKKFSTIIMALALVLGMSQCKKQETPTTGNTTPTNPGVHITVNVGDKDGKDNNGEKHNIAPAYGLFSFSSGDQLYVGHNGEYVGMLTFNGACFDGTIYPDATVADNLHFYFLGNAAVTGTLTEGETTSLSISIADQSGNLPVLSYGASKQTYSAENTSYSATLKNKCALVRFDLQNQGLVEDGYVVTLSGVPTLATVNFANPTAETAIVATEGQTNGNITLYSEDGVSTHRWAILLPGTDLDNAGGLTIGSTVEVHEMGYNTYINSGISINNPLPLPDPPAAAYAVKTSDGTLTQFSVSVNKKVYFSRANLKCNAANPNQLVWDFHDNQIDECPGFGAINSTSGTGTNGIHITNSDEMDRFSWGFHSPTTISEDDWVDGSRNLSRADGTDWGCALIGTDYGDNWRTLTAAEWQYLLSSRSGKRFLRATWKQPVYNGTSLVALVITNGIFIAPDGYNGGSTSSYTEWNKTNKIHKFTGSGYINLVNELLNAGCVFLPALGYRQGSYYYEYNYHYSQDGWYMYGNYWTATGVEQQPGSTVTPQAKAFRFEDESINYAYSPTRNLGMCVRLVWDAN